MSFMPHRLAAPLALWMLGATAFVAVTIAEHSVHRVDPALKIIDPLTLETVVVEAVHGYPQESEICLKRS